MKKKILFLIHDLGEGGAEKVLVNLVNHLNREKFEITVMVLFGGGVNEQFLADDVRLIRCFEKTFPANSRIFKLFSPKALHDRFIQGKYDIEIAFLEGPAARIVSGCTDADTKCISWIHTEFRAKRIASIGFRSFGESAACLNRMDQIVCVSESVRNAFCSLYGNKEKTRVCYNVIDTENIQTLAEFEPDLPEQSFRMISAGKIVPVKGFDRLARIHARLLKDGFPVHTYILGHGLQQGKIEQYVKENGLEKTFSFLGYQINPYQYMKHCDLFVCSSYREGYSTAVTESLIVGTPVCTTEVSGMRELLGENGEYGLITENDEEALYNGIRYLLEHPEELSYYKRMAEKRGMQFDPEITVKAVETLLENI